MPFGCASDEQLRDELDEQIEDDILLFVIIVNLHQQIIVVGVMNINFKGGRNV